MYKFKNLRVLRAPTDSLYQIGGKGVEIGVITEKEAKDLIDLKRGLWFYRSKWKGALTENVLEYRIGEFARFHTVSIFSDFKPSFFLGVFDITIPKQHEDALIYRLKHNCSFSDQADIKAEIGEEFPGEAEALIARCHLPEFKFVYQF